MTTAVPSGSLFSVQPLSIHSSDSSPALLIHFNTTRYLFNVPESISRVCVQGKIGLKKVDTIFLGALGDSAGLPGTILTTVETGNNKLKLVGPPGTDHLLASCRYFTKRDQLSLKLSMTSPLTSTSTLPPPISADENLVVYAIPLSPTPPSRRSTSPSPSTGTLKRKRSSTSLSPSPPPTRSKSPPSLSTAIDSSLPTTLKPLSYSATSQNFNPSYLVGADAAHWRSQVLSDMFKGQAFSPAPVLPLERSRQTPSRLPLPLPPPATKVSVSPTVVSYLAVGPPLRGKFLPQEAKKRGARDTQFSRLAKGERVWVPAAFPKSEITIALEKKEKLTKGDMRKLYQEQKIAESKIVEGEGEGSWVDPSDCLGPQQDGSAVLILNIPSHAYLYSLSTLSPSLFSLQTSTLKDVFYFLGPGVLSSPLLHQFAHALPTSITHHFSSPDIPSSNPVTFVPAALLSLRLSYLSETIFRLPQYSLPSTSSNPLALLPTKSRLLDSNRIIHYGGVQSVSASLAGSFNFLLDTPEAALAAATLKSPGESAATLNKAKEAWDGYVVEAKKVKGEVEEEVQRRAAGTTGKKVGDGIEVTPLGTGSAIPSKYRNVSSTLIFVPDDEAKVGAEEGAGGKGGYILLDAGEGTWGQLARRFGEDKAREEVLRELKLVFISHLHQDHHAGLGTILRERAKLSPPPKDPLTIVAPQSARIYLTEQQSLFDLGLDKSAREAGSEIRFLDSFLVEAHQDITSDKLLAFRSQLFDLMGLEDLVTVPVLHRCRAWGIAITHKSGWKIVFSGDTTPCDALVEVGMGATLLIHEATIQDDMPEVAIAKGHSTFGQAIDIARRMNASKCLLTHFSARYPKLPPLIHEAGEDEADTVVAMAFDLMTLRLDEFWMAERYRAPMDTLLGWDEEEGTASGVDIGGDIGE